MSNPNEEATDSTAKAIAHSQETAQDGQNGDGQQAKPAPLQSQPFNNDYTEVEARYGLDKPGKPTPSFHTAKELIFTPKQWKQVSHEMAKEDTAALIGTPTSVIVRPGTKTIIEAAEKSFKTTLLLRQTMGMAYGHTVYPSLPIVRPTSVLYLHGELVIPELELRRDAAIAGIPQELLDARDDCFLDGRSIDAHLIRTEGQKAIRTLVHRRKPGLLVIDPWQEFIRGYDENAFKDTSLATEFLDRLMFEIPGMALFISAHTGKDSSRGMRGHSSLAGWRDTLIRIKRKGHNNPNAIVSVFPRWAAPLEFKVKFQDGTLVEEGSKFSPQTMKIRDFVASKNSVTKEDLETFLDSIGTTGDEATRKAIQRAEEQGAILGRNGHFEVRSEIGLSDLDE